MIINLYGWIKDELKDAVSDSFFKTEVGLLTNRDELRKKDIQFIKLDMLQL